MFHVAEYVVQGSLIDPIESKKMYLYLSYKTQTGSLHISTMFW